MPLPSLDLDNLSDTEALDFCEEVIASWAPRQDKIKQSQELRDSSFEIPVPRAWRATAEQTHSSLPKEIMARVIGTITLRDPQYSRPFPDDDMLLRERATRVKRYLSAQFQLDKRTELPGKNAYTFAADQMAHSGALAKSSIFSPHAWAGAPLFTGEDGTPKQEWWRDEQGQETDDIDKMHPGASARAYKKGVEAHRIGKSAIKHRIAETRYVFPVFTDDRFFGMIVQREASVMEIKAGGFMLPVSGGIEKLTGHKPVTEFYTANRIRMWYDKKPLEHPDYGAEGIVTNYGFVPWSYRTGLEGGSLDWGSYGLPLLHLVDPNIRLIDQLLTWRKNALYQASFTSWFIKHIPRANGGQTVEVYDKKDGRKLNKFDFESGSIMDFGPDREVQPFTHPGLNADFDKMLQFQIEEVHRIIPRTLQGEATSSGYNTAQSTVQAKAIFGPMVNGMELVYEDIATMDLHHINDRVPGPIYLNYEGKANGSARKGLSLAKIEAKDIGGYYGLRVTIDQETDLISRRASAANAKAAGLMDDEEAYYEGNPDGDYEAHLARLVRDRLWQSEAMQKALETRAIKRFGLQEIVDEAQAMAQVVMGPDGTPLVKTAGGGMAGPGIGSLPSAQGPMGATAGTQGQPNLSSTANPTIGLPAPNAPAGGNDRLRRRGGAVPNAPQRQPNRPVPSNAAA